MTHDEYTRIALDEGEKFDPSIRSPNKDSLCNLKTSLYILGMAAVCFGLGFGIGGSWSSSESVLRSQTENVPGPSGKLDPQSFVPEIPMKDVEFKFPTGYEDTGDVGDQLWKEMMPLGAGFLRIPFPRNYDMPPSKIVEGDHEFAEIYSMSMTHQLHCLAVVRHVIMRYEVGDKSRFAGDGHEYHCLDYIRQSILCAGDTTLDHADIKIGADGSDKMSGFSGSNSTHQCRDWDVIKMFLIENRAGDNIGILI